MQGFWNVVGWNIALAFLFALMVAGASLIPAVRRRPALRHCLWLLVMIKLVTPPLIPLPVLPSRVETVPAATGYPLVAERWDRTDVAKASTDAFLGSVGPEFDSEFDSEYESQDAIIANNKPPAAAWSFSRFVLPSTFSQPSFWLLAVWFVGTAFVLIRMLKHSFRLSVLLRRQSSSDERLSWIANRESGQMGLGQTIQTQLVAARITPLLWRRRGAPLIVLPKTLVGRLDDDQLACIVRHELAHHVRRDHWANAIAAFVGAMYWWNPLVWWARREMRLAQEACCDAYVTLNSRLTRRCYAETLLRVIDFLDHREVPLPQLVNGFGEVHSIQRRFKMLANEKVTHRLSPAARAIVVIVLGAVCCFPVLAQSPAADDAPAAPASDDNPPAGDGQTTVADTGDDAEAGAGQDEPDARQTKRYPLTYADAAKVGSILEMVKAPNAVVRVHRRTNQIEIIATPQQHRAMQLYIRDLDSKEEVSKVIVFALDELNAESVALVLRKFFGESADAPTVHCDRGQNRIVVRGTDQQVAAVRDLIQALTVTSPKFPFASVQSTNAEATAPRWMKPTAARIFMTENRENEAPEKLDYRLEFTFKRVPQDRLPQLLQTVNQLGKFRIQQVRLHPDPTDAKLATVTVGSSEMRRNDVGKLIQITIEKMSLESLEIISDNPNRFPSLLEAIDWVEDAEGEE